MAILNNNPLVGASGNQGGYNINNSLRFRDSAGAYLNRTFSTPTNNKIWTWSGWVKRGLDSISNDRMIFSGTTNGTTTYGTIFFNGGGNTIRYIELTSPPGTFQTQLITTAEYRDFSAWYHIVLAVDTTQATASNRVRLYVNGAEVTSFSTATYPSQNATSFINSAQQHRLGSYPFGSPNFDGYMAEVYFVDGQQLTPSSFGETDTTTGVWKPKAYSGTYGTNGFYLKFSDIATTSGSNAGLGKDFSGNSNYWTTNNISVTSGTTYDAMTDSPTNTSATVANYAVMNPLDKGLVDITGANLNIARTSASASWAHVRGTMQIPSSGKWYAELTFNSGSTDGAILGLCQASFNLAAQYNGSDASNAYVFATNGYTVNNNTATNQSITFSTGDIINMAFDRDTNKVWFGRNNTWLGSGNPSAGTNETMSSLVADLFPLIGIRSTTTASVNFGQRPFAYTPPTGFVALNTFNLPTPTILQGNRYMNAVLYTGNGSTNAITGVGFSPDFVWVKNRAIAEHNCLYDSVRGIYKQLYSNLTNAEDNATNSLLSFDSDGFTLGNNTTPNTNGNAHVAWNWRGSDSTAVSNTSGSITSTVSVNTTAGFSVVLYTGNGTGGATVGHGLGVAPKMIIVKARSSTGNWIIYHASMTSSPQNVYIQFNTSAYGTTSLAWNNTAPTSTTFSLGSSSEVNGNGTTFVAYCWAEIAGFSKFGSYDGNGQTGTGGPFIYTGFRPAFVLIKKYAGQTDDWFIFDNKRNVYNVTENWLQPNTSSAETSNVYNKIDMLSNGFGIRVSNATFGMNVSGTSFIYMAFAENPTKFSLAR